MSDTLPLPEAVLARVAELRAEGNGWTAVAKNLGYEADELKRLCEAAGTTFDRLLRKAHDAVVRDGLAEAITVLRFQMRLADRTTSRRAAEIMARIATAERRDRLARERLKLRQAPKPPKPREQPERLEDLFPKTPEGRQACDDWRRGKAEREYLDRTTPEQLEEYQDRHFADECHRRGYHVPGEEIPYWHRPDYVNNGECIGGDLRPWYPLTPLPDGPPPESPLDAGVAVATGEGRGEEVGRSRSTDFTDDTDWKPGDGDPRLPKMADAVDTG